MRLNSAISVLLVALLGSSLQIRGAATESYPIDPAKSRVTISVGKAGAFSFLAGHTHEVVGPIGDGTIDVDRDDPSRSRVHLAVETAGLEVTGKGEPPGDVPKVQSTMAGPQVLDVARFSRITFESATVRVQGRHDASLDLSVTGPLTIRDRTQEVTVPVHAELTPEGLTATGRFQIKQTAFGITPISVGGVVAVKDRLDIAFSIVARKVP